MLDKMHEIRCRVRYAETDQMGVVYYAHYFVWMEIGRAEFIRSLGIVYRDIEKTVGLFLSVVDAQCRYIAPARYDQVILISTEIAEANARIVEFSHVISDANTRTVLARGTTKHMWLNRDFKSTKLPPHYLNIIRQTTSDDS